MSTYQKADGEVTEMAASILKQFESHKPLLEAKVRVDFVFAYGERDEETGERIGDALTLHGFRAFGITRKLSLKDRTMGRGDAEIAIDGRKQTRQKGSSPRRKSQSVETRRYLL